MFAPACQELLSGFGSYPKWSQAGLLARLALAAQRLLQHLHAGFDRIMCHNTFIAICQQYHLQV
jgi:hypothetical protein